MSPNNTLNACVPPIHTYRMFGHAGSRRITCLCGRTRSLFEIRQNDGKPLVVNLNVQEAIEHGDIKLKTSQSSDNS